MKRMVALLAVIVIGVAIAAFFFRAKPAPEPAGPLPELVSLAPQDAVLIVYLDAAAVRVSPLFHRLVALLPPVKSDEDYAQFVRATGFDYTRDLDRAVLALLEGTSGPSVALIEGRLDRGKILAHAGSQGRAVEVQDSRAGRPPVFYKPMGRRNGVLLPSVSFLTSELSLGTFPTGWILLPFPT